MARYDRLTREQKRAIYEAYAGPVRKAVWELAEEYGTSERTVRKVTKQFSYFVHVLRSPAEVAKLAHPNPPTTVSNL